MRKMLKYKLNSIPEAVNPIVLKHIQIKALPWYINNFKIMLEHSQQISYKEFKQSVQESVSGTQFKQVFRISHLIYALSCHNERYCNLTP